MRSASEHKHTNRLARESSPYLLQHAHNPVDWFPWGEEAFTRARSEDKPIFLSVGYSTCYWCHVMERQCFENESIARLMNERFVNIKVDREQRPDVDQLYMTAVQVLTRHGGWPMSVFLTPELKPFYGGTYFPPEDAHGRPGFPTLLRALDVAYRSRRGEVEKTATELTRILQQLAEPPAPDRAITIDPKLIDELIDRSIADYDPHLGGFGSAPKFPRETLLELLLTYTAKPPSGRDASLVRKMILYTLDAMANGGMRDQLGGGFHRYSTDAKWLVPHFEIMLYDQAMLGWCYVEAFRQTSGKRYANIARGILDFVLREMTSPDGEFYTALDAEVGGQEGQNYLWTAEEVRRTLTDEPSKGMGAPFSDADAKDFLKAYGLDRGPNFADPHHGAGQLDKNILFLPTDAGQDSDERFERMRKWLLEERSKRKQPLLDTKILPSWNALMIRALAHGGAVLTDPRYLAAARRAASSALEQDKQFLDDYAFLAHALLSLHEATNESTWRDHARTVFDEMRRKFAGDAGGFYFTGVGATDLIVRQMVGSDSPLPSGNGVAAMVALALNESDVARGTLATFVQQLLNQAEGMSAMLQAAMLYVNAQSSLAVTPSNEPGERDRPLSPQELASRILQVAHQWRDAQTLKIRLRILQGFHINAHDASTELIATELRGADRVDYPPAERLDAAFADEPINVYRGEITLVAHFEVPQREKAKLSLRFQACDEASCLPPTTIELEVPPAT